MAEDKEYDELYPDEGVDEPSLGVSTTLKEKEEKKPKKINKPKKKTMLLEDFESIEDTFTNIKKMCQASENVGKIYTQADRGLELIKKIKEE